jgi:hypothetical protein
MSLAGRFTYHCLYRPAGRLAAWFRDGGPLERRRTEAGRIDMLAAAKRLAPLASPPPGAPAIHLLTGARIWPQTAFLLTSLSRHCGLRAVIHDDGTLHGEPKAELQRIATGATFSTDAEARARLDHFLPVSRFPRLRQRRERFVLFRKLLDVRAGAPEWRLFLDSDQLCLRRPELLLAWLHTPRSPLHMTDVGDAYGCPREVLTAMGGHPVPPRVNTGILGLNGAQLDWDKLEAWCGALDARMRPHYYHEQALVALHLAGQSSVQATPPDDYVVLPRPPEAVVPAAIWHHYVAGSKRWYYQTRWRDFAAPRQP